MVAGAGFEPYDLRVMSPTSYQAAPPRDETLIYSNKQNCVCQCFFRDFGKKADRPKRRCRSEARGKEKPLVSVGYGASRTKKRTKPKQTRLRRETPAPRRRKTSIHFFQNVVKLRGVSCYNTFGRSIDRPPKEDAYGIYESRSRKRRTRSALIEDRFGDR